MKKPRIRLHADGSVGSLIVVSKGWLNSNMFNQDVLICWVEFLEGRMK